MKQDRLLPVAFEELARYDADKEVHQLLQASVDGKFSGFIGLPSGTLSDDGSVIVGDCGFLFVRDGSNQWSKQLNADVIVDDITAHQARDYQLSLAEKCADRAVDFRVVIYPEKDIIYPEFSPNVNGCVSKQRSVHKIITEEVRLVYPAPEIVERKHSSLMFHRRNSHVSFYGGLVAANCVIRSMDVPMLQFEDILTELVNWPDDLSMKWVADFKTIRRRVSSVFERKTIYQPIAGHVGTHVQTINDSAAINETVVIFGDSYSWNQDAGLVSFLSLRFRKVYFVWSKKVDWNLIEEIKPQHLILQSAERFLIRGFVQ